MNSPDTAVPAPHNHLRVDLSAIRHNVALLANKARCANVMVVVKADGYNHGAVAVAETALTEGATHIGVATLAEALELRRAGIRAPILCWLHGAGTRFVEALTHDVEIALSDLVQLRCVVQAARTVNRPARVTLKVDTGMARNGIGHISLGAMLGELTEAVAQREVELEGLFTHLSHADDPGHPASDQQRDRLLRFRDALHAVGLHPRLVHAANSAATLTRPDLHFDMVRPGIAVYGFHPVAGAPPVGLQPAMTWESEIVAVRPIRRGDGVSYGHAWTAPHDTDVALVPVGYADGVLRSLSGRIQVGIKGRAYSAIGRICMDQFVIELGPGRHGVRVGDPVRLLGPGDGGELTAQQWAELTGSIPYEILTFARGRATRSVCSASGPPAGSSSAELADRVRSRQFGRCC